MKSSVLALVLVTLTIVPALATGAGTSAQSAKPADSSLMMMIARADTAEIALADIALRRSTDADVKAMAEKLKADHQSMDADVQAMASKSKVTLPTDVTPQQKDIATKLGKLIGPAFDKAYLETTATDHQDALKTFTQARKTASAELKAFIDQAMPIMTDHLRRAITLQKRVPPTS